MFRGLGALAFQEPLLLRGIEFAKWLTRNITSTTYNYTHKLSPLPKGKQAQFAEVASLATKMSPGTTWAAVVYSFARGHHGIIAG
jgi:hypothetical protein